MDAIASLVRKLWPLSCSMQIVFDLFAAVHLHPDTYNTVTGREAGLTLGASRIRGNGCKAKPQICFRNERSLTNAELKVGSQSGLQGAIRTRCASSSENQAGKNRAQVDWIY